MLEMGLCPLQLLKYFVLLTFMYFAEAYIVPAIGNKDPVSSGGWEVV